MDAKDILRLALFVFFFAFALRSGFRLRIPGPVNINSKAETEDTETQQILQHLQENRGKIKQDANGYENTNTRNEVKDTGRAVPDSANAFPMIIVLLAILSCN